MATPTHLTVTAPPGRVTPIHKTDGVEPGGATMFVVDGDRKVVRNTQTIRRSIARGDLIICADTGKAKP